MQECRHHQTLLAPPTKILVWPAADRHYRAWQRNTFLCFCHVPLIDADRRAAVNWLNERFAATCRALVSLSPQVHYRPAIPKSGRLLIPPNANLSRPGPGDLATCYRSQKPAPGNRRTLGRVAKRKACRFVPHCKTYQPQAHPRRKQSGC